MRVNIKTLRLAFADKKDVAPRKKFTKRNPKQLRLKGRPLISSEVKSFIHDSLDFLQQGLCFTAQRSFQIENADTKWWQAERPSIPRASAGNEALSGQLTCHQLPGKLAYQWHHQWHLSDVFIRVCSQDTGKPFSAITTVLPRRPRLLSPHLHCLGLQGIRV